MESLNELDSQSHILVRGARTHNLQGIDVRIPKNQITVILGPSGAGKSSLAIDTLYAEGSRRYLESLNFHARQMMGNFAHTEVDQIIGLSPSVELKAMRLSPGTRSSVGTLTEIDALLRTLFFKSGITYCMTCQKELKAWTIAEVVDEILKASEGQACYVLAPKRAKSLEKDQWIAQGMIRAFYQDEMSLVEDLEWKGLADLELVVDRFKVYEKHRTRIWEAVETAFQFSPSGILVQLGETKTHYSQETQCQEHGFSLPILSRKSFSYNSTSACEDCKGLGELEQEELGRRPKCQSCEGHRLQPAWEQVKYQGLSISQWSTMSLQELAHKLDEVLQGKTPQWEESILKEMRERLETILKIGLGYLHLYRSASSLSSGEYQRIRIATQIGSRMSGICYFLDEPLTGLHLRDQMKVWLQIQELKFQGNTIVLVEHNRYAIDRADYVVELGPGSGSEGGRLMYQGSSWQTEGQDALAHWQQSLNLSLVELESQGPKQSSLVTISYPEFLCLKPAKMKLYENSINVLGGVSGSGKSTLLNDLLVPLFRAELFSEPFPVKAKVKGLSSFHQLVRIDSQPLRGGRRSSPASLTGIMDSLRKLFAKLPESKVRGYNAARFSLNKKGGRCEHCLGEGVKKVDVSFLPDSNESCVYCNGSGFNGPTLEVLFKGHNLAQVLEMNVLQALKFFRDIPEVKRTLETMVRCGIAHLPLGISANQLSGGEMQRLKLARELKSLRVGQKAWILMDEPSRGLFFHEVQTLIQYWRELCQEGHSILLVDHHPDVLSIADHLEIMGPGSGPLGGELIEPGEFKDELKAWLSELSQ